MEEQQPITDDQLAAQITADIMAKHALKSSPSQKSELFDEELFRKHLPSEMLNAKRWMRFFLKEKPDGSGTAKIPLGDHGKESTWSTFEECVSALEPGKEQGLGFAFYQGEIEAFDVDHCCNPNTGQICNEVMLLMGRLKPCWAEFSVSGRGIHLLGYDSKGLRHTKPLTETCLQAWPSQRSARFFALTCRMVGTAPDFNKLGDWNGQTNYVYSDAKRISAKIREELKAVDPEQWAALPKEREPVESVTREKSKTKTRKVAAGFDIKDFLQFYNIPIDNECDNELGHCIRIASCPIKGEPHVSHNSTTCNFIYPTKDGGLAFHCQSTGCVEYGVGEAIRKLADGERGSYPKPIYEKKADSNQQESGLVYSLLSLNDVAETSLSWLWINFLPDNQLVHFQGASSEGKSPVTLSLIACVTTGKDWPDGTLNTLGPRSVILMAGEDDLSDTVIPRLRMAGADISKVHIFKVTAKQEDKETALGAAIDRDYRGLVDAVRSLNDLALIVIDPITNYLGKQGMNNEVEIRGNISMPLKALAQERRVCIITVGHLNKRDKDATVLQRSMGAAAFTGVPRKVFVFGNDPEDDNKHAHVMSEVRDKQVAIQYKTVAVPDPEGIQQSPIIKVEWGKVVEVDAEEVVNAPKQREKNNNTEAKAFLKAFLKSGARTSKAIEDALKEAGIDCPAWQRVAKRIPAKCSKAKGKNTGYEWCLPTSEQAEFDIKKEVTA
jgi:putative DNA primase/helicase